VVGHSYILYAPLLAGATTVLYEGKPVGTPDASAFWRVLKEYNVNVMFTAPTALRYELNLKTIFTFHFSVVGLQAYEYFCRAIRKEDPESKYFKKAAEGGGLKKLRALFLAGERSEPSIVTMYQELLSGHCAPGAVVNDK